MSLADLKVETVSLTNSKQLACLMYCFLSTKIEINAWSRYVQSFFHFEQLETGENCLRTMMGCAPSASSNGTSVDLQNSTFTSRCKVIG